MRTSEKVDLITKALLEFQAQIETPKKNETGKVEKGGVLQYEYDYASLPHLLGHCKDGLIKNGLVFTSVGLTSRIMHTSGQWIEGDFPCEIHGLSAQQVGSVETYGRRYSFQGLLGICAEEDDDAAKAQPKAPAIPAKPTKVYVVPKVIVPTVKAEPLVVPDEGAPEEPSGEEAVMTLKAMTKERQDKKNNVNRGILFEELPETWYALYDVASLGRVARLKGKRCQVRVSEEDGFRVCHEIKEAV